MNQPSIVCFTLNLHFTNPIFGRFQNASQSSQMTAEEVSHNSVDNVELSTNNKQNKSNIQEIISDSRRMVSEDFEYPQRSGQASFSRK